MPATKRRPVSGQPLTEDQTATQPVPQQPAPSKGSLLQAMLSQHAEGTATSTRVEGVLIGWIDSIDERGSPMVAVPGILPEPRQASALCPLAAEHVGAQCAVMFAAGQPASPIVMGLLHHSVFALSHPGGLQVQDDGETLHIAHAKEIALHCGKASLRMTQDGRIELRGTTLISHATGLNRVRGASVKLN